MASLEYAHARMSARYGARPDDLAWRRLEPLRLAPALDAARATALAPWMTGIGPATSPHEIEALLRRRWRDLVAEVAAWMPESWRPAIRWCAAIGDLAAVAHLARGGAPQRWMRDDPVLRGLAAAGDGAESTGPLAPLMAEPERVAHAWLAAWRQRLPAEDRGDPVLLDAVVGAIGSHVASMRDPAIVDATPLLRALEARLVLLFRRAALDPASAFAFLALCALDLARLRGELVRRAAFPGVAFPGLGASPPTRMIRPRPARWFEILAARDDATLALEALASTGAVELEARAGVALPSVLADLRPGLAEFAELASRYRPYWPERRSAPTAFPESPAATLARSLGHLSAWAAEAEPAIRRLQRIEAERDELVLWRRALTDFADSPIDFAQLAGAGPVLHARLLVYPADALPELPRGTLVRSVAADASAKQLALLVVGDARDVDALARTAALCKGRVHEAPPCFAADLDGTRRRLDERLDALADDARRAADGVDELNARHELTRALADADRLQWLIRNVRALEAGEHFCWITGWTSDLDGRRIAAALERSGARGLLRFAPPVPDAKAPLLLANAPWARPFEVFCRAMGMPSSNEADPSALLAFAVPLMFGYMFGDVGQGLVVAAAGFVLRRRHPIARLFVAGGLAAAVFGALFGSVFSVQAMPALWVAPLDAPLTILLVPLAGGALLLTVGLALNALEAWWRGEPAWLATDLGYVVAYLGILAGFLHPQGFVVAAAGAAAFCLGSAAIARSAMAGVTAIAALAERLVQILINTLSFARVGAFALAHAGLSSAIVALADASDSIVAKAIVLVAGNVVVLALETLVVSIQTTRLVLFEFFTRFLAAGGRMFRPLPVPPSFMQETAR